MLFNSPNYIHPALKFTLDKETDYTLSFLDVLVHMTPLRYVTSIYRKYTFTGLYTRWDSFCPIQQKINLIKTRTHRALKICSESTLDAEIKFIYSTCSGRENSYFGLACNLIRHLISPNQDYLSYSARTFHFQPPNLVSCQTHSLWLGNADQCRRHIGRSSIAQLFSWTMPPSADISLRL